MGTIAVISILAACTMAVAAICFLIKSIFTGGRRGLMLKRSILCIFAAFILMMAGGYFASEENRHARAAAEAGGFESVEEHIAGSKLGAKTKAEYAKAKAEYEETLTAEEKQKAQQKLEEERNKAEAKLKRVEQKKAELKVQADQKVQQKLDEERKLAEVELEIAAQKQAKLKEAEEVERSCRSDLQCFGGKHQSHAGIICKKLVERLAKFQAEWTDGFLEAKFSHFRWKNKKTGVLTYIGDKVKFQNGFGAWQHMIYECDYDPQRNFVLDVRADPGRL